jgi:hypothetical protein
LSEQIHVEIFEVNSLGFRRILCRAIYLSAFFMFCAGLQLRAQEKNHPIPKIMHRDGRYALFVGGAPYLMLGAQINNSSAWPSMLPKVWPAIDAMHANTVEMPVYWEQMEPEPGRFDYSVVDILLAQARAHHVHLVLLWFGTWKNGSSHYMPLWLRNSADTSPHMIGANGRAVDSPSPYSAVTLKGDIQAFTALMNHLKATDGQRTVIMVQVENEPGTWGSVRDFSPDAQKLFEAPVPKELLSALHTDGNGNSVNWEQAFGEDADVYFHTWSVARYIQQVAAAGKAAYPLPLYVNAALRDPLKPAHPPNYETGGATDNVIPIWKATAPAIDVLAPDIYMNDREHYLKVLDLYRRPDNPLFVPETSRSASVAPLFFEVLGRQAIGFSPFGVDFTSTSQNLEHPGLTKEALASFAMNYELIGPMDREIARLNFEGKLQAVAEEAGKPVQTLEFGSWQATISYGMPQFGRNNSPQGNPEAIGRVLIAQLGDDKFLVSGFFCRVDFRLSDPAATKQPQFMRVEEGNFPDGVFKPIRIWNGDQTDWGVNFGSVPQVLQVSLGTY